MRTVSRADSSEDVGMWLWRRRALEGNFLDTYRFSVLGKRGGSEDVAIEIMSQ